MVLKKKHFLEIGTREMFFSGEMFLCFPSGLELEKSFGDFVSFFSFFMLLASISGEGRNFISEHPATGVQKRIQKRVFLPGRENPGFPWFPWQKPGGAPQWGTVPRPRHDRATTAPLH